MTETDAARSPLGQCLERDRLSRRARRLELVVRELRVRADARTSDGGSVPAPLGRALSEFATELHRVRARLNRTR